MKILIFNLNKEYYATDIQNVERILGYETPTELPNAPYFVEGVINQEDSILPIIDISKEFKLSTDMHEKNCAKKIIVVKREKKKFGIVVNNVSEVKDVDEKLIEDAPEITKNSKREYIKGLIRFDKKIVILLDLEKLLSSGDEDKIFKGGRDESIGRG